MFQITVGNFEFWRKAKERAILSEKEVACGWVGGSAPLSWFVRQRVYMCVPVSTITHSQPTHQEAGHTIFFANDEERSVSVSEAGAPERVAVRREFRLHKWVERVVNFGLAINAKLSLDSVHESLDSSLVTGL